jgi:hypothetical protein
VEKLEAELKRYRHYEFLYEEEKLAKTALQDLNKQAQQAAEDYKRQADRLEHKANKAQKELEAALTRISELEHTKETYERDREVGRAIEE